MTICQNFSVSLLTYGNLLSSVLIILFGFLGFMSFVSLVGSDSTGYNSTNGTKGQTTFNDLFGWDALVLFGFFMLLLGLGNRLGPFLFGLFDILWCHNWVWALQRSQKLAMLTFLTVVSNSAVFLDSSFLIVSTMSFFSSTFSISADSSPIFCDQLGTIYSKIFK